MDASTHAVRLPSPQGRFPCARAWCDDECEAVGASAAGSGGGAATVRRIPCPKTPVGAPGASAAREREAPVRPRPRTPRAGSGAAPGSRRRDPGGPLVPSSGAASLTPRPRPEMGEIPMTRFSRPRGDEGAAPTAASGPSSPSSRRPARWRRSASPSGLGPAPPPSPAMGCPTGGTSGGWDVAVVEGSQTSSPDAPRGSSRASQTGSLWVPGRVVGSTELSPVRQERRRALKSGASRPAPPGPAPLLGLQGRGPRGLRGPRERRGSCESRRGDPSGKGPGPGRRLAGPTPLVGAEQGRGTLGAPGFPVLGALRAGGGRGLRAAGGGRRAPTMQVVWAGARSD